MSSRNTLSPFRYPGGKTWLIPFVRRWLESKVQRPREFVEPFAGGGSVGLAVAYERLTDHVTLVEKDEAIAAVWRVLINGEDDVEVLIQRIMDFVMSEEAVDLELNRCPRTLVDHAFRTILRNRINRGGILAPGAGRLKRGENGRGLASRWYPGTLTARMARVVELRLVVSFIYGDGLQVIKNLMSAPDHVFFIDPPYSATSKGAGRRLYTVSELDHEALFLSLVHIKGDFLATYDDDPAVRELASTHGFDSHPIPVRNSHHTTKNELLIGKDLTPIRQILSRQAHPELEARLPSQTVLHNAD
jgi:DNA adenine methylase